MNTQKPTPNIFPILWLFVILLFVTGCNQSFEPWQENDQYHFSIYGYLDASADTQWVRIMPVREDIFLEPKPIDAVVTLEHMESGEIVEMNDSLFEYSHDVYAYNFWAHMELQPGQNYRIRAENSDGDVTQATVTLPPDFPTPLVHIERRSSRDPTPIRATVLIQGIEKFADIQTVYRTQNNQDRMAMPHLQDSVRTASGDLQIIMEPQEDFPILSVFFPLPSGVSAVNFLDTEAIEQHIFIASAGPDFLYFPSIDEKVEALPDGVSNIENGVGYLAGITSKTIPYSSCTEEGSSSVIPCDSESPPW